jgi:Uma2 family endonuclease
MSTTTTLLTAEEYLALPDNGQPNELVRGEVMPMNLPTPRHGQICARISFLLAKHLELDPRGHVIVNDSGVVTARNPDTVRGPDVAYYSYARLPPGPLPRVYLQVVPELVFEVRSPTDPWRDVQAKAGEFLRAGVSVVCVIDEQTATAHLFSADEPPRRLTADEELHLPAILGDFRVAVRRFLE